MPCTYCGVLLAIYGPTCAEALTAVAQALARAGDWEGALAVAERIADAEERTNALAAVAQEMLQRGISEDS